MANSWWPQTEGNTTLAASRQKWSKAQRQPGALGNEPGQSRGSLWPAQAVQEARADTQRNENQLKGMGLFRPERQLREDERLGSNTGKTDSMNRLLYPIRIGLRGSQAEQAGPIPTWPWQISAQSLSLLSSKGSRVLGEVVKCFE